MALQRQAKVALLFPLWLGLAYSADFTKSECFDSKETNAQGTIIISCPENFVISVDDAIFGTNRWGACIITEDDCTEQTKIFQVCDGQVNCTRTFKTFTRTCGYSTMLVLGYSCIRSFTDHSTNPPADAPETILEKSSPEGILKPRGFPTSIPKQPGQSGPKSNSKDKEEIGLIIGCALASFITVVFLVIAIVMVIRRLLQNDEKEGRDNAPRSTGDCGSVCIKLDCLPCFGRSETPRKSSHDLRMRKKTAIESGTQSDQSKLRVAPIGEESIADQGSTLSEGQDSTSSGSSIGADEVSCFQPPQQHGELNLDKPHWQKQQRLQEGISQPAILNQEGKNKRGNDRERSSNLVIPSGKDHDNENTLPSSCNRNLEPLGNEILLFPEDQGPAELKNVSCPPQHTFDAVAIPNTLGRSDC